MFNNSSKSDRHTDQRGFRQIHISPANHLLLDMGCLDYYCRNRKYKKKKFPIVYVDLKAVKLMINL